MEAQVKLIKDTYRRAGLDISETGYVEAHMTGTSTGDLIEAEALAKTFGQSRPVDDPIIVGSVKTNIGHAEPVSGLAAIIKTSFALRDGVIPQNMNYQIPNKNIPLEEWHLRVPTALTPWPSNKPFRASLNNFGYGGSNAHIILERAPEKIIRANTSPDEQRNFIFLLSAKDTVAAKTMVNDFASHVRKSIDTGLPVSMQDLAYTCASRRSLLPWVVAVSARNLAGLCDQWESPVTKAVNSARKPVKRLGFVFNGQGAQWFAMARELISAYPLFNKQIHKADQILKEYGAEWSLYEVLMQSEKSTRINEVDISQPSTVAIQLCLVDLLKAWSIVPAAVTSHSSGEIAAAYTVRALTFKEALGVIFYRGQLAKELEQDSSFRGGMAAVGLGPADVKKYITNTETASHVVIACVNSPDSVTLSGELEALDAVVAQLDKDGIFARKLKVPLAYHSHQMLKISKQYTAFLSAILPEKARDWESILFFSPVTGEQVTSAKDLSPSHWARNLTSPVLFSQAFENMCYGPDGTTNVDMIIEIGAHSTLSGPIRQIQKAKSTEIPYVTCLKRSVDAVETMQELACEIMGRGYPVSLESINFPSENEQQIATFIPDLPT